MLQDMSMDHRSNSVILSGGADDDLEDMDIESVLSKGSKNLNAPGSSSYVSPW
jgi:hypothetical protein